MPVPLSFMGKTPEFSSRESHAAPKWSSLQRDHQRRSRHLKGQPSCGMMGQGRSPHSNGGNQTPSQRVINLYRRHARLSSEPRKRIELIWR